MSFSYHSCWLMKGFVMKYQIVTSIQSLTKIVLLLSRISTKNRADPEVWVAQPRPDFGCPLLLNIKKKKKNIKVKKKKIEKIFFSFI